MRKLILTFVLGTLSLCAFSQEAFYIYRNDGDFNGFFYDEVIEMRQSKISVDSVEYDRWVTQEVVLADTTYRIPLAAIDSISFIQPEIKINPNVRLIERDGYSPYLVSVSPFDRPSCSFHDLPISMIPRVGDVLIALPTDSKAEEMYYYTYGYERRGGSWSCVVDEVRTSVDNYTYVEGHWVDQISDVFEQYITVEQIGVDENNQIHRRIAGCTPEGLPRRIQKVSDDGEITLIDFTGTITHGWNPTENTSVDLSAELGIKMKLRVAYDITWTKFYVKMTQDLMLAIKPSIGLALSYDWIGTPGKFLWMPEILFPAAAPVFRVNPLPEVFIKTSGSIEARFNMPQVKLGVGNDIIFNSTNLFPISMTLNTLPDEEKKVTDEMLDLSRSVSINGSLQMGIEFQAIIGTASWFKKIVNADIGLHLYTGPKLSANFSYDSNVTAENNNYWNLSNGYVNLSLLALDLEAGATAGVMWNDPEEVTFFKKSWEFMIDTCRLAPIWYNSKVEMGDKNVLLTIKPHSGLIFMYNHYSIGVFKDVHWDEEPVLTLGDWYENTLGTDAEFWYSLPMKQLKAGTYKFCPLVSSISTGKPYRVSSATGEFKVPFDFKLEQDEMHFGFKGGEQSITFTANCPRSEMSVHLNDANNWTSSYRIDTISLEDQRYSLTLKAKPNRLLFGKRIADEGEGRPWIAGRGDSVYHYFNFIQDENDLQNVKLYFYFDGGGFTDNTGVWRGVLCPDSAFTASRNGEDQIVLHTVGSSYSYHSETSSRDITYEVDITLQRNVDENGIDGFIASGSFKKTEIFVSNGERTTEVTTTTFQNAAGSKNKYVYDNFEYAVTATLSSGTYDYEHTNADGEVDDQKHTTMQAGSTMKWYLLAGYPAE